MAQSGIPATPGVPYKSDITITVASATGTINVGDWVAYSGQYVWATNSGHTGYWKTSGAGVALESNPMIDQAGRSVQNSAIKIQVEGVLFVSASFSGVAPLGLGAFPDATGSAVGGSTGLTGVGATWNTAQVINGSAYSGTANAQRAPVATVIGGRNYSNAGTGELMVRLMPLAPDVRG